MTLSSPSPPPSIDYHRKRVARACEGCRLRKSKCDGRTPCSKCKANNIICTVWKSKRPKDKVYPKGYVEVLEGQRLQLIAGLQEAYRRLEAANAWPGKKLSESSGQPLVHDILLALNVLQTGQDGSKSEGEERIEDFESTPGNPSTEIDIPMSSAEPTADDKCKMSDVRSHLTVRTRASIELKEASRTGYPSPTMISPRYSLPDTDMATNQGAFPEQLPKGQNRALSQVFATNTQEPRRSSSTDVTTDRSAALRSLARKPSVTSDYIPPAANSQVDSTDLSRQNTRSDAYSDPGCYCIPWDDERMLDQKQLATDNSSWWMSDMTADQLDPDVGSPGTDSLSDMLYREIRSNHFIEMYDHAFDFMEGAGSAV